MMNPTDWQAVRDALIADDRAKLGEPPTAEELLAYERGELSPERAERVQQLLVAYPELARAFATPFPPDDVEELPAEVLDRQWKAFRGAQGERGGARVLQFWRVTAAIAAAVAIAFGAMFWRTRTESLQPHILPDAVILTPDGKRGVGEEAHPAVPRRGDSVVLVVSLFGPTEYESYRLELARAESGKRVWSSTPLPAPSGNSFNVEVPLGALQPGTYSVIAYGLRGGAEERVATYTIDVR